MKKETIQSRICILISTALVFFSIRGTAQNDAMSVLQLSAGPSHIARQDLIFSPFIHRDLSVLNIGAAYQSSRKTHQYFRLNYSGFTAGLIPPYDYSYNGDIKTAYPHSFTFVGFGYGIGKFMGKKEARNSILGLALQLDVQAMTYQYGRFSFFGYYSTTALSTWFKRTIPLTDRSRLEGRIELPLVSWLARSPYLINDDEFIENTFSHNGFKTFFAYLSDGHLATWNEIQQLNASLHYAYDLSKTWQIGAGWAFSFLHSSRPEHLYSVQNNFHLTLGIKL